MSFPGSPKVLRGAIIGVDLFNPLASIVVFQYNPDTMTRTISAQAAGDNASRTEAMRLKGPPQETIRIDVEIDAADQLAAGDSLAATIGIYPALASLEMLLYPKALNILANEVLARLGVIEIIPPEMPLTLLVWGLKRVLPVRLTQFSITEEAFDPDLNPIRAKASLELRVLNYDDLGILSVGGGLFLAHQLAKEVMASISGFNNLTALPGTVGL